MPKNLLNFYGTPTVFQTLCSEHSVNRIDPVLILQFMLDWQEVQDCLFYCPL